MRYYALRNDFHGEERKRVVKRLVGLKESLSERVPAKIFNENVLIATWNIRDFDSNKFRYGPREKESFYYIAEILSSFDLIAIQEVNEDLYAFKRLMYILGGRWDYIMTDVTEGRSGNKERMAYVYDTNRISFKKLAGEIVLADRKKIEDERQFARTPFLVAFQSGWFKFKLCTVHIYYGSSSGEKLERRIEEISTIAETLSKRAEKYDENLILLGDFNIVSPEHETMKALEDNGFMIPDAIKEAPSNMYQTKHYDQIAFKEKEDEIQLGENENSAGVYNLYNRVFATRQFEEYRAVVIKSLDNKIAYQEERLAEENDNDKKDKIRERIAEFEHIKADDVELKDYYKKEWRTFQMSDHLPMWTELKINFSMSYLNRIKNEG